MKLQKNVAILGILVAQALVLSLLENMIPIPIAVPGVKLGLANLITLLAIMTLGLRSSMMVVVTRTVLTFFIVGVFTSFLFSLAGGISACIVMYVFNKFFGKNFGMISVSVMGAITHNLAQLVVASIVMKTSNVFSYMPVLLITGLLTGILIGLTAHYTIKPLTGILRIGSDKNVE